MKDVSIYNYTELSAYLIDYFKAHETSSKAFSFRSLSTRLTDISHSQLYQIVKGKKKFPLTLVQEMTTKILKLNRVEKRYFKALVELNHYELDDPTAKGVKELQDKLQELRPIKFKKVEFNEVTSKPLTMMIFEMIVRSRFKNIKSITTDVFVNAYTEEEIQTSLDYLVSSKHLSIDSKGNIIRLVEHLMSPDDVPSKHIRDYHKEIASYVPHALDSVDVSLREFQSIMMNINSQDIPKAKELIREFLSDFIRQLEVPANKLDSTYNFNFQFFPLIKE